jgi:hypothetical protein
VDQVVAVGVTVEASVVTVGGTVVVVGVSVAMGHGVAVMAAGTVAAGSVGSSSVSPPPLSTDADVGVSVGGDCSVGVVVTATTVVVAISVLVIAADGSTAVVQPTRNIAASSHCMMFVILMMRPSFESS